MLDAGSPAIGRSQAEVGARGLTGASVFAITRDGDTAVPGAHEPLRAGDVLAIAGTAAAIASAATLLVGEAGQRITITRR